MWEWSLYKRGAEVPEGDMHTLEIGWRWIVEFDKFVIRRRKNGHRSTRKSHVQKVCKLVAGAAGREGMNLIMVF